jgi:plastocyanin
VALLALLTAVTLLLPGAAAAEVRDVRLTQDGPEPAVLQVRAGDVVRFVNTDSFVHAAVGSAGWSFDTGPLLPGRSTTVPPAPERPGAYPFRGTGLDTFTGTLVVAAGDGKQGSGAQGIGAQAGPSPTARAGGSGSQATPPISGSGPAQPGLGAAAPPGAPGEDAAAALPTDPDPARLRSPVPARGFGLPLALAVLLVVGVASLLLRVLLAEPVPARPDGGEGGSPTG